MLTDVLVVMQKHRMPESEFLNVQQKRLGRWLDNEEVCEMLCIAKRTLQAYREKKLIPYTQVGHKIYYKPQDVEALLKQSKK